MKKLLIKRISKLWGTDFSISDEIPLGYVLSNCLQVLMNLLRGKVKSNGFASKAGKVYVGKKVNFRAKSKIFTGLKVRFEDYCEIDALSVEGFHFGNNVKIGPHSKLMSGSITNLGKGIWIGDNCFFSDYSFFGAAGGIKIGNNVIAGQNIRFHSENHNFQNGNKLIREQGVSHQGIELGDDIWIGSGAVFLDGARVGSHCVVAANAVVQKEFPDNCVIGGIPAKIIKRI